MAFFNSAIISLALVSLGFAVSQPRNTSEYTISFHSTKHPNSKWTSEFTKSFESTVSPEYTKLFESTKATLSTISPEHTKTSEFATRLESTTKAPENPKSAESTTKTSATSKFIPEVSSSALPWFLQDFSANVVHGAINIRSSGIPESEASAVAHTLIDSGLAHPQYTSLAKQIVDMVVDDSIYVNATSLSAIAASAKSAYQEIRTEPAYSNYIDYATSHATIYDFNLLTPAVPSRLYGAESQRARQQRAAFTSIYASLVADPSGHVALDMLNDVAKSYIRDFSKNSTGAVNVSIIENVLTYLLN